MSPAAAAAVERLIPHRPPFRFVDELTSAGEDGAVLLLRLGPGDPRLTAGRLQPLFLLEALTQAAAAFHGASCTEAMESGVLVEVTSARLLADARAGDEVELQVRRGPALGPLVRLRGRALARGTLLVESEFTVMRTGNRQP